MKKTNLLMLGIVIAGASLFTSCDDDGLTSGDPNYWTTDRGQFTANINDSTTMFFLDNGNGTASVTFDGSNPLHWQSSTTANANITTYTGTIEVPSTVTYNGKSYDVTAIGDQAFLGNRKLTNVTLPETITSLGEGAFELCTTLQSIEIPAGVNEIPLCCFARCAALTTVTIPQNVTSIGKMAFFGCIKLKEIHCQSATPPTLAADILSNVTDSPGLTVYVPAGSKSAYEQADYWKNLTIEEE